MSIELWSNAGGNRRNSVEIPLHHHAADYYTKSHELSHTRVKLMKLKLQDPSCAWSPSMPLVGALAIF